MIMRSSLALAVILVVAPCPPLCAQTCGPITFAFSATGAGCAPFSGATPPSLGAGLVPFAPAGRCAVKFTLAGTPVFPIPVAMLLLGPTDPGLSVPLLPGCVLRTTAVVAVPMDPDPGVFGTQALVVQAPASPALLGATVFTQAFVLVSTGGAEPRLSNGVRMNIS